MLEKDSPTKQLLSVVNEGLIRSYDSELLIRILKNLLKTSFIQYKYPKQRGVNIPTKFGTAKLVEILLKDVSPETRKEVDRIIKTHGYIIAKETPHDPYIFLFLEPKYPSVIFPHNIPCNTIHLTDPNSAKKIQKTGLIPKLSRSSFSHDQNIYVLAVLEPSVIPMVAQMIAENRNQKAGKDIYDYENWVFFDIDFPPRFPALYIDNMFIDEDHLQNPRFLSLFSKEPISPKFLDGPYGI